MRRAKTSEIVKYGFGGIGSNIPFLLMMFYSMYFYTDIFGISAGLVGAIFLTARLVDAFTDPLMGMLADRTRTKMGKFRPWIKYASPLMGLATFLVFATPGFSMTGKIIYAFVTYIFYSVVSTAVNIPYHSLTAAMSEDPNQRTTIAIVKQSFMIPAFLIGSVFVLPIIGALGGGQTAWAIYGAIAGVFTTLTFWVCQSGAKLHDTPEIINENPHAKETLPFKESLKLIYKNSPLLMLLVAFGTDMIAFAAASAVNVYFFVYYLERPDLIPLVSGMMLIAMFLVFPFLSKRFGKKEIYLVNSSLLVVFFTIWFFVGPASIAVHLILAFITATLGIIPGVLGWAMVADCVDYAEWKLGKRAEGTVTSLLPFVNKLGMAIGGGLVGLIIANAGYVANADIQVDSALLAIRQVKFLYPVGGYIASVIAMKFYVLNKSTMKQMAEELQSAKV